MFLPRPLHTSTANFRTARVIAMIAYSTGSSRIQPGPELLSSELTFFNLAISPAEQQGRTRLSRVAKIVDDGLAKKENKTKRRLPERSTDEIPETRAAQI